MRSIRGPERESAVLTNSLKLVWKALPICAPPALRLYRFAASGGCCYPAHCTCLKQAPLHVWAFEAWIIPTITPKIPRALPKISTINTFTKSVEFCASANAHELPAIPTHTPLAMFVKPTPNPAVKRAYPPYIMLAFTSPVGLGMGCWPTAVDRIMARITP